MTVNGFRIKVDPKITVLAGFEYGREIWNTQCASNNNVDVNQDYYLILPAQIECVAPSFVNGFFESIVEKIGAKNAAERLHVILVNRALEEDVKENIMLNV